MHRIHGLPSFLACQKKLNVDIQFLFFKSPAACYQSQKQQELHPVWLEMLIRLI